MLNYADNPKACPNWEICRAICSRRNEVDMLKLVRGDEEAASWLGCADCALPAKRNPVIYLYQNDPTFKQRVTMWINRELQEVILRQKHTEAFNSDSSKRRREDVEQWIASFVDKLDLCEAIDEFKQSKLASLLVQWGQTLDAETSTVDRDALIRIIEEVWDEAINYSRSEIWQDLKLSIDGYATRIIDLVGNRN